eukprot:Stramenopile-MAST_4_protein_2137
MNARTGLGKRENVHSWSIADDAPAFSPRLEALRSPLRIPRTALSPEQVRLKVHAEHDVFASPVGQVQVTPTEISDCHGQTLYKIGMVETSRKHQETLYAQEKANRSKVPVEERVFVSAMRKAAHSVFHKNNVPHQVFRSFDREGLGTVNVDEFRSALQYVGVHLTPEENRALFDGYLTEREVSEGCLLNYDRFLAELKRDGLDDTGTSLDFPDFDYRSRSKRINSTDQQQLQSTVKASERPTSPLSPKGHGGKAFVEAHHFDRRHWSSEDQTFFILRSKVFHALRAVDPAHALHAFVANDRRRSGYVNGPNFLLSLKALGVHMAPDDCMRLFQELPKSNNGHALNYAEFVEDLKMDAKLAYVRGQVRSKNYTSEQSRQLIIQERVFEELKQRWQHLDTQLNILDINRSGKVDFKNFYKAIKMAGIILSDPDTHRVFDKFDGDNSGVIDYRDLVQMLQYGLTRVSDNPNLYAKPRKGSSIADPSDRSTEREKQTIIVQQKLIDHLVGVAPKLKDTLEEYVDRMNAMNRGIKSECTNIRLEDGRWITSLIDSRAFADCARNAGAFMSEKDAALMFRLIDAERVGRVDYMRVFDFLTAHMTEKPAPGAPPIYLAESSKEYQDILHEMQQLQAAPPTIHPNFGVGLVPKETDNISRTGNLGIEQILLKIQKQAGMESKLLERCFIGLCGSFGKVNKRNFSKAMGRLGVNIDQHDLNLMFKKLCVPGESEMDVNMFFQYVRREYGKWHEGGQFGAFDSGANTSLQ